MGTSELVVPDRVTKLAHVCIECKTALSAKYVVVIRTDLRAAHARRTRAAIRAAALTLIREHGYAAMTVDDVAALAGVSRRSVFNHFSSKADILVVGLEPPDPEAVEAFVAGTGPLLEDLGALLGAGAQNQEPEREWLLACPDVVRDNPEVECAVHERFRAAAVFLTDAVERRLDAGPEDLRVRSVVALAMAIHRASMSLWMGDRDACPESAPDGTPPDDGATGDPTSAAPSSPAPRIGLADAVRSVTAAMSEVLAAPGTAPSTSRTDKTQRQNQ